MREPCPCDKCELKYFVRYGTFEDYTVRMPDKQLFTKIFYEDDTNLKNYLVALKIKDQMQLF